MKPFLELFKFYHITILRQRREEFSMSSWALMGILFAASLGEAGQEEDDGPSIGSRIAFFDREVVQGKICWSCFG